MNRSKLNSEPCAVCATSRAIVRIPREPARRQYDNIGDIVFADMWSPYQIARWDKTTCFLFVIDDATRKTWAKCLSRPLEALNALKTIYKTIERQHSTKIKRCRADNQMNKGEFDTWCTSKGIAIEPTAPWTHHQVGVAERNNRTVREEQLL